MIKLTEVTEDNWLTAANLSVRVDQKAFVAPAVGIIARGYVYRDCRGKVFVIKNDDEIVGLALVREFTDEPLGYDLQQFMIDERYQGRGYGGEALKLILDELRKENRFNHVEVCVKKDDANAIHLYEKHGFNDSGYFDEEVPDSLNMICCLTEKKEETTEMKDGILPAIAERRSIRKYSDREVTDEQTALLIEAARRAPSGNNKQPWDFIVVRSEEMREKVCKVVNNQRWMMTAPVFIVCIGNEHYRGDGDMERVIRDSAIATEHILLQAAYMGLGSCWTGRFEQKEIRELLGLDDHCYVIGVVTIGYPDAEPTPFKRREIEYKVL